MVTRPVRRTTVDPSAAPGARADDDAPDEGDDPEDMTTTRVEAFSDGVLSIAITLLVLDLHFNDAAHLTGTVADLWSSYVAYVLSFLIIGVIWMNHHLMFHHIRRVDRLLLIYNLLMLMCVAFLPWAANVLAVSLQTGHGTRAAAVTYGVTLAAGGAFFNAVWWHASNDHRHLSTHITRAEAALMRKQFALGPVMYLVAAAIGAVNALASLLVYVLLLISYMFEAGSSSRRRRRAEPGAPAAQPAQPARAAQPARLRNTGE